MNISKMIVFINIEIRSLVCFVVDNFVIKIIRLNMFCKMK